MTTFTKVLLSGSTNGKNILISATSTPGDTVHTAISGVTDLDEIYLFATNLDTVTRTVTIEFGGVASPDDLITMELEAGKGAYLVIPGWDLQNSLVVSAFADVTDVVVINGFVNRITA